MSARLTDGGIRVDVVRGAALAYRDRLREVEGVQSDEIATARDLVQLARSAELVAEVAPEAWITHDDRGLAILLRVIRWRTLAIVVDVSVRDESLGGADVSDTAEVRGLSRPALDVALWYASPVDVAVSPERWRSRSRIDRVDCSIIVERRPDGAPMVTHAVARAWGGR